MLNMRFGRVKFVKKETKNRNKSIIDYEQGKTLP